MALANLSFLPGVLFIHTNRRFMREEQQLTESLENFDLQNVQCHSAADRAFVHLAISAWYGSEEAFTEYVRGPLRKELMAASGVDLPFSYALLIVISPFCMAVDVCVAMIRAGAPVEIVLAEFTSLGLGITMFWLMLCIKVMWSLCSRWASLGSTWIYDCLVTMAVFLVFMILLAGGSLLINGLLLISPAGAIAAGIVAIVVTLLAFSSRSGCQAF